MTTAIPDLVVGRDRAHVRSLLSSFPQAEVISASAFFDKVRLLAYLKDSDLRRDDLAPLVFAQSILSKNARYSLRLANHFSSLYSAFFHGTCTPEEVWDQVSKKTYSFSPVVEVLVAIDQFMKQKRLVTGVSALHRAWQIIKHGKVLPPSLLHCNKIALFHLIDLTALEIEVIKDLSRLGLWFDICFPLDFQKRGINVAVDFCAKLFEADDSLLHIDLNFDNIARAGPLLSLVENLFKDQQQVTLSSEHCSINIASDVIKEADFLAKNVAKKLAEDSKASIAVVVRKIDARSELYKRALKRHGINVKDRKGIPLTNTSAGLLFDALISARLRALPKTELLGLLNHPLFVGYISDLTVRAFMISLVNELGADDGVEPAIRPTARYHKLLTTFKNVIKSDHPLHQHIDAFHQLLDKLDEILLIIANRDTFQGHLRAALVMVERALIGDDPSIKALHLAIKRMALSLAFNDNDAVLDIYDFWLLLKSELNNVTIPQPDMMDLNAVELLLLPELLGRSFDHVFIVDIAFGRMPQNSEPNPLLDDQQRLELNQLMKKTLLRIYFDDPFEPMPTPPRQALEPFWFASAVASARCSVHFSCASSDEALQEQAPSEFFTWLLEHVSLVDAPIIVNKPKWQSSEQQRFWAGVKERVFDQPKSTYFLALQARKAAFIAQTTDEYAFSCSSRRFDDFFLAPNQVLTPTAVEAFAACRFSGFLSRILKIAGNNSDQDDVNAQSIGQIAHRTLEKFSADHAVNDHSWQPQLRRCLSEAVAEYAAKHYISKPLVLACHQEWLFLALTKLVSHLQQEGREEKPVALELSFGLKANQYPPLKISANKRNYWLGGRVDRIEQLAPGRFLIVDYKLSGIDYLKSHMRHNQILRSNFQVPIYLRLIAQHFTNNDPARVSFAFASIRDGEMLPALALDKHKAMFQQIFDDDHQEGLPQTIDGIFAPIIEGRVPATVGEHCATCDFSYVCRRKEWEQHVA